jgi:hypothetical protein
MPAIATQRESRRRDDSPRADIEGCTLEIPDEIDVAPE